MKKRLFSLLLLLVLAAALLTGSVLALGSPNDLSPDTVGAGLPHVTDRAGVLTAAQQDALSARAAAISQQYGCDVYIVVVDYYRGYSYSSDLENAADDIREAYDLDKGNKQPMVMLLHAIADREFGILAHGSLAHKSFTDYGKDEILDKMTPYMKRADWSGAYEEFLDQCERLLDLSARDKPLDVNTAGFWRTLRNAFTRPDLRVLGTSLIAGVIAALVITAILGSRNKSVAKKQEANDYITPGGVTVTYRHEQFSHTTTTRVRIEQDKSSGGGRGIGGTTINSRGSSFSGRKY